MTFAELLDKMQTQSLCAAAWAEAGVERNVWIDFARALEAARHLAPEVRCAGVYQNRTVCDSM